jgi:hypothetical protein
LFVAAANNNTIEEFTPGGVGSIFATLQFDPHFIAIQAPEPATGALLALGVVLLGVRRRHAYPTS